MEDHAFGKARRAAKRERDRRIRQALRTEGRKPGKAERRLQINSEFITLDEIAAEQHETDLFLKRRKAV